MISGRQAGGQTPWWRHALVAMALAMLLSAGIFQEEAAAEEVREGTGLPLPRFVSLRAGKVNMRAGPSVRYPIAWVYRRAGLPVEIIAEFDTWRKIRDWQGSQGWVHQSMLSGNRAFISTRKGVLRQDPDSGAPPVARLDELVVGRLTTCSAGANWCRVEARGYEGWFPRDALWGMGPDEIIR